MLFCSNERIFSAGSVFLSPLFCASRIVLQQAILTSSDLWIASGEADPAQRDQINWLPFLCSFCGPWKLFTVATTVGWNLLHNRTAENHTGPIRLLIVFSHHFFFHFFPFSSRIIKSEKIMVHEADELRWKLWAKTSSLWFPNGQHRTNYWDRISPSLYLRAGCPQRR